MKKNNKKEEFVDDGHTIYDMNVEGFKWYKKPNKNHQYIDKDDKKIMIKAAYKAYFRVLLMIIISFGIAFILIYLWLK